ncbi:MAG: RNA-binding domain-containing protein [Desulfurococcaceae archaeon]
MASSRETKRRRGVEISHIEVAAFCHATEDCFRVEESVRNVFPQELRKLIRINRVEKEGYYGNPISIITARISDERYAELITKHLAVSLGPLEKAVLKSTFDLRYDPKTGRFVVRFSKQDLLLGRLRITDSDDVVKVVFHLKSAKKRSDALNFFRNTGLIA